MKNIKKMKILAFCYKCKKYIQVFQKQEKIKSVFRLQNFSPFGHNIASVDFVKKTKSVDKDTETENVSFATLPDDLKPPVHQTVRIHDNIQKLIH